MHYSRSAASRYRYRRILVVCLAFLLALGGLLPAVPSQLFADPNTIVINDVDSYGIAWERPDAYIYQYSGTNPSPTPVARVQITGIPSDGHISNGLAVAMDEDVFYAYGLSSNDEYMLYKITPDGSAESVTTLPPLLDNGVISQDGTKYYYMGTGEEGYYFGSYDLTTGQHNSIEMKGVHSDRAADLVIDSSGYAWFTSLHADTLYQMDPHTGEVLRSVPVTSLDGVNVSDYVGVRGLSFLPNGDMLISSGSDSTGPAYFILSASTLQTTYIGSDSGALVYDLASRVYPTFDANPPVNNACSNPVALVNGSFEQGPAQGSYTAPYFFLEEEVPGWQTTDDSQGVKIIEIWNYAEGFPAGVVNFPAPPDGNRYAELNAYEHGLLYQDVETTPGQTIYWRLSHMGRHGVDTMQVRIGPATDNPYDTIVQTQMSSGNTAWESYEGEYTVPAGQTVTRFGFEAVSTANGILGAGNFLDDIFLGTEPCVEGEKTVSPQGDVHAGDELTYEVTIKNEGGDIAANAVFEDAIPEGTEYVPGSMKILTGPNAGDLTDEDDQDAGHFDGDKVIIELGSLPNTTDLPDGITVQFKVTVLSDYAVREISNQAQISFDNLLTDETEQTETNETTTTIIYNDPILESAKTVSIQEKADGNTDTANPEVGDTLLYTIQTRNTSEDSLVSNLVISDSIPEGLEYVPGSLTVDEEAVTDAEDGDNGHYTDGQVVGQIGDVTDTEWHSVTFQVKVLPGQAGKDIVNTAHVSGDNIDEPDEPENKVEVYPRDAVLESDKTASLFEKADGNTDTEHPEVGDTLLYTITARNTVSDSVVTNLTITDELPEGLEYVPGSITVNGVPVTDAVYDDNGYYADGRVVGLFGDVTDTEWRTLEFKATIQPGQAQKDIRNVAIVEGDNVDTPSRPEEEVEVYPRHPVLESEKIAVNQIAGKNTFEVGDRIVYTIRTRTVVSDTYVGNLTITDTLPAGLEYVSGSLKVDGVSVTDAVYDDNGHYANGQVVGYYGNITDMDWHTLEFEAIIREGQGGQTIRNTAVISGDNIGEPGQATEEIAVESPPTEPPVEPPTEPPVDPPVVNPPSPVMESRKTSRDINGGSIRVGDTLEYTITTRNTVSGSRVENLVISDQLPEGLEYVPGSLKVNGIAVTDAEDDDNGYYADGRVVGQFGNVTDTDWHTLEFRAVVRSGQAGQTIENTGEVSGDNIGQPDRPRDSINVGRSGGGGGGVIIPNQPVLESQKTSRNLSGDGFKVGDRIEYTLRARNTVSYTVVTNLVISDQLPEGLVYVPGSLKVDGTPVTDERDNDNGYVEDGKVVGQFGSISDTDWHSIEFQVEVQAGQAGNHIVNVGEVTADNVSGVERPSEEIVIGDEGDRDGHVVQPELPGNPDNPPLENEHEDSQDDSDPITIPSDGSEQSVPPQVPVDGSTEGSKTGSKLPNTATNVYNYLLTGFLIILAGLFLLRRKTA